MTIDEAVDLLWKSAQKGLYYPPALHGQLTLEQAYGVQLGVLARAVAGGDQQAGWKIGLSAEAVRGVYGVQVPTCAIRPSSRSCVLRSASVCAALE
jgi:2-keto-4-pentenoate hydratase